MGPPLTESPGRCRVHERGRTGSLKRQTQPCGAPRRVLKGWREQQLGIGCRLRARRPWRVSGTPNSGSWQGHRCMHCEEDLRAITSGAMANSGSRTRAWRAGNDCDAFCSIRSRARTALGNLYWTRRGASGQGLKPQRPTLPEACTWRTWVAEHALEPCLFTDRSEEPIGMRA